MIISTVHTRHSEQLAAAECTGNFGFLHDHKLVNTALTRAKSCVAVVGDPALLCSVGSCSPIWKAYLQRCFHLHSLQPTQLTMSDIYVQSQELIGMHETSLGQWTTNCSLTPDEIVRRLGVRNEPKVTKPSTSITYRYANVSEYETDYTDDGEQTDEILDDGDVNDETHDEEEIARLEGLLTAQPETCRRCTMNIKHATLAHAVSCDDRNEIIVINGRENFGHALHGDEVVVKVMTTADDNRQTCSEDDDVDDAESDEETDDSVYGAVVGVLKPAFNLINRTFICRRDNNNANIMIPLNFRIPKVKVLRCEKHRNTQQTDVVCLSRNGRWKHYRLSSLSLRFSVKIIKWEKQKFIPLGRVVAVVKSAVEEEIDLLEEKYGVHKTFCEEAVKQAEAMNNEVYYKADDYQETLVFTVDDPETRALDDALSVKELDNGYMFGIHISDVSSQVPYDSPVDKEARKRCLVFYAVGRPPQPMLPEKLSYEVSSLLPGEMRPTISVFIKTDSNFKIQENGVAIRRCHIRSRYQLTYDDVENENVDNDEVLQSINRLQEAALIWRRERLGNGSCYRPPTLMSMNCITARTLVEEMMIMANYQVAKQLVRALPRRSPLRHQLPQTRSECRHRLNASADTADDDDTDDDTGVDTDADTGDDTGDDTPEQVQLSRFMLHSLLSAARKNEMELVRCLVTNIQHQPQLALESIDVYQNKAKYICSGKTKRDDWQHCSLKLPHYVHFTSPIRRYVDIVVHRMLLSVIEPNNTQARAYTEDDIANICQECNDAKCKALQLKYESCNVRLCSLLRERSVAVYAVVCSIRPSGIELLFPNLQDIAIERTVKFSSLKPSTLPRTSEKSVKLQWKQRIYDLRTNKEMLSTNCRLPVPVELDADQHVMRVRATDWKKLVDAVTAKHQDAIVAAAEALHAQDDRTESRGDDLTSEGRTLQSGKHFCEYSITFSRASIVKVQLAAKDCHSSRPHIQLLHLTPRTCICVEHNTNVVESFSKPAMEKANISRYNGVDHYQKLWLPVLAVEAAYSAITDGNSIIVHNVDNIHWKQQKSKTTGTFDIGKKFCKDRNITFPVDEEPATHDTIAKGYICVRYSNSLKSATRTESAVDTFRDVIDVGKPFTWVGHCVITQVVISADNSYYVVHLLLKQNTCALPKVLKNATIEWFPKLVPDR